MNTVEIVLACLVFLNTVMLFVLLLKRRNNTKLEESLLKMRDDVLTQQRLFGEGLQRGLREQQKQNLETLLQLNQQNLNSLASIGTLLQEKLATMENKLELSEQTQATDLEALRGVVEKKLEATHTLMENRLGDVHSLMDAKLVGVQSLLDAKLADVRGLVEQKLESIREDNNAKLEQIRGTVDEKLQSTLEQRIASSFRTVTEELKRVYEGLGEMKQLATGVDSLRKILGNVKTRGILGEVQLGAILEEILAPEQYERDVVTVSGTKNRVEFAIHLPGQEGESVYLPIDSKFPGDLYAQLQDAKENGTKEEVEACYKALEGRIRQEANDIHTKYIAPPETTEFGIMFLPFEGLYAEVVSRGMLQELQRKYQVTITGPSTMAAYLNSLRMGFRTLAIQKRSSEVWSILGAVKTEFGKFEEGLKAMKGHLDTTSKDLDKLMTTRTNVITRRLRTVEGLEEGQSAAVLQLPDATLR